MAFPGLREGLFGQRPSDGRQFPAPPIARYVSEDGDVFTLDRTQPKALLKFDNSYEVWALQPQPAPRGDTIYKNDLGEPAWTPLPPPIPGTGSILIFTDDIVVGTNRFYRVRAYP